MLFNLFWLSLGSGLTLLGNLALSHKMSIEDFGTVTGLFALASFLAVFSARGQQGLILSRSPGVHSDTLSHSLTRSAPVLILVIISVLSYYKLTGSFQAQSLVILLPFVTLTIASQLFMGISQAKADINWIGFYQSLPAMGRSLPAFLWISIFLATQKLPSAHEYFQFTGFFCLLLLMAIVLTTYFRNPILATLPRHDKISDSSENSFWLSSILSSSYASLMAPLILFTWGEAATGAFGVYLLLWGVANIVISSIFNNYLLPKYAAIRFDNAVLHTFLNRSLFFALLTSSAIGILCIILITSCMQFLWPDEYRKYEFFFYICTLSLMIRPFSASIGLPLNFSNKVKLKTRIQLASIAFLALSITTLATHQNYILLSLAIVASEIIVLTCYLLNRKKP